jgi:hypothetical protein
MTITAIAATQEVDMSDENSGIIEPAESEGVSFADLEASTEEVAQGIQSAADRTLPDLARELAKESVHDITVHVKVSTAVHTVLKSESERTGLSLPYLLRDYSIEFIKYRNESLSAASQGIIEEGSMIHNMMLGLEGRLLKTVEVVDNDVLNQGKVTLQVLRKVERIEKMIDLLGMMYFMHTQQIPEEFKDGHAVAGVERHQKWLDKVKDSLGESNG